MIMIILLLLVGLFSGMSAGLLGIGGGLIFLPFAKIYFIDYLGYDSSFLKIIIASSTLIIFSNSLGAVYHHQKRNNLILELLPYFIVATLIGAALGVYLIDIIPLTILKWILFTFLLGAGLKMFTEKKAIEQSNTIGKKEYFQIAGVGLVISTFSSMLGLGGGASMTPILHIFYKLPVKKVIGTASLFTLSVSGSALFYFLLQPPPLHPSAHPMIGYVDLKIAGFVAIAGILGSWLGTLLLNKIPVIVVKRGFAILLLIAAVKMFF